MNRNTPGWTSYFLTGTLALVLSWVFTGCKFGNNPGGFFRDPTFVNLYYETEPAALTYCSILEGEDEPICGDLDISRIPGWATTLVSNPLGIQLESKDSVDGALFNALSSDPTGLPTQFEADTGTLGYDTQYEPDKFWFADGSCLRTILLSQSGTAANYESPTEISGLEVSGRLALDLVWLNDYSGDGCAQAFAEIQACHQDAAQCGEESSEANQELHEGVMAMFAPYTDSGALMAEDISRIVAIGYQVSYR